MEAVTWIDRITEETNPWFMANNREDEGDYLAAVLLYLDDATDCLGQRLLVKGALSSSCAADCLEKMGQFRTARVLYSETARIYLANSESAIATSVRESLWSLREAYEYLLLAEEWSEARLVHDRLARLARRVDPSFGPLGVTEEPQPARVRVTADGRKEAPPLELSTGVAESIERFLLVRRSPPAGGTTPGRHPAAKRGKRRVGTQDENSIISQLG
jgi:hypothetical protein